MTAIGGWHAKRLKYFVTRKTQKGPVERGGHYIGLENIEPWTGRFIPTDAEIESESSQFKRGDVLFGKLRPYLAKVHVAQVEGTCTSEMLVLRPREDVLSQFLFYRLISADFIELVNSTTFGSKMPRADWDQTGNISIAVPTLKEQTRVVSLLDGETCKVDALIAKKRRLIELLDEKRLAVINRAVTRGIDLTVRTKPSGVEWIPEPVPAHWEIAPLTSRFEVKLGKMLDARQITGQHLAPYLRNVDVQWDRFVVSDLPTMDFDPEDRKQFGLKFGDLLVCEGGEVGRAAVWQNELASCCYQKALHRLRPRGADVPRFFLYVLRSAANAGAFRAGSNQNTIDHLTAEKLRWHRFPFPPPDEQSRIAALLDQIGGLSDPAVSVLAATIDRLREYRSALITAAVTGQLNLNKHEENMEVFV